MRRMEVLGYLKRERRIRIPRSTTMRADQRKQHESLVSTSCIAFRLKGAGRLTFSASLVERASSSANNSAFSIFSDRRRMRILSRENRRNATVKAFSRFPREFTVMAGVEVDFISSS